MQLALAVLSFFLIAQALLAVVLAMLLQYLCSFAFGFKPSYVRAYLASFLSMAVPLLLSLLLPLTGPFFDTLAGVALKISTHLLLGTAVMLLLVRNPQVRWKQSWPMFFISSIHAGVVLVVFSFVQLRT